MYKNQGMKILWFLFINFHLL